MVQQFLHTHKKRPALIENEAKISAAWLIDECKLKGYKVNDAGIYKKHSLIIVNYGDASYKDIMNLAIKIQEKVIEKFGICLTLEPNVISSSEKKAFRLSKFYYETYNHDY